MRVREHAHKIAAKLVKYFQIRKCFVFFRFHLHMSKKSSTFVRNMNTNA